MTARRWLALAVLLCHGAYAQITLQNNQVLNIDMPAGSALGDIRFEAPASTRQLVIRTTGTPGTDIDVFARAGRPFPPLTDLDFDTLFEAAQHWSISSSSEEVLRISEVSRIPPAGRTWHLLVANFGDAAGQATLRVEALDTPPGPVPIEVNFLDGGRLFQTDCTPGRWTNEARQAMQFAVQRLSADLTGTVPVRVNACWVTDSSGNSSRLAAAGTLASAINSPDYFSLPGLRTRNTWYPVASAIQAVGTSRCGAFGGACTPERADIGIIFESTRNWSFSTGDQPTPGQFDFVSVAMHELAHGLGFQSLAVRILREPLGTIEFLPLQDAYTRIVRYITNLADPINASVPFWSLSPAERRAAITQDFSLAFGFTYTNLIGAQTVPFLHAPNPVQPGSSFSHFNAGSEANELMVPTTPPNTRRRSLGLAGEVLRRAGWSDLAPRDPLPGDPYAGQWFDPARPGHGIDLVPAGAPGNEVYVLTFYTYDESGTPEWYLAVGPILEGRFVPQVNAFGDTLVRYTLDFVNRFPPQRPVDDPDFIGRVELQFDGAEASEPCLDGTQRDGSEGLGAFYWRINGNEGTWCMQPLLPRALRSGAEFTGHWYAGDADQGWGMSITNWREGNADRFFGVLYYGDAQGQPRWAYFIGADLASEQPLELVRRRGYCRTCPPVGEPPWTDTPVGVVQIRLIDTLGRPDGGNRIEFMLNVPEGPGAGSFGRGRQPIQLLSRPLGGG